MRIVEHLFRGSGGPVYLPVCVCVILVRDNTAVYAWVAEPLVVPDGAKLRFHAKGDFRPLNPRVVSGIIDRVNAWYEALPQQLALG